MDSPHNPFRERLTAALADRYRIEHELGQGGMATVYLAEDLRHRRRVALKVLKPELAAVLGAERFIQEITTTAALQHPHILPLFDSGTADGFLYYVMPFIDGETLRGRLDRDTQLGIDAAVRIATDVASALHYAHQHGVIHRDIKPENILLHDGRPMVADFGIALALSAAAGGRMTETGMSLGTPHYMSPEQATAEKEITARSDVYSLGSVLYEMLSGTPPHTGASAQQIIMKIIVEPVAPVTTLRKSVPPNVAAAVAKSLEKLPADRFESARAFGEALGNPAFSVHTSGAAAAEASAGGRVWQRRFYAAAAVGLVLLGVASAAVLNARSAAASAAASAEPRFWSIALPDSAPLIAGRWIYDEALRSLDISADGKTVVYGTRNQAGTRLLLVRTDNGTVTPLPNTSGAVLPTLSPDGLSAAFVVDTQVRRLTFADGIVTRVASGQLTYLTWSDDDRLYAGRYIGCPAAVAATGGELARLPAATCLVSQLAAIPGRPNALVGANQRTSAIELVDARTGTTRSITAPGATDTIAPDAFVRGAQPMVVAGHYLVFLRDSTMYAAPFDFASARLLANPKPILANVRVEAFTATGHLALSASGTLVWAAGGDGALSRFAWVDATGKVRDTLPLPPAIVESYALSSDGHRLAYSVPDPEKGSRLIVADLVRHVADAATFTGTAQPLNWIRHDRDITVRRFTDNALVHASSAALTLDTTGVGIQDESPDGTTRCSPNGFIWRAPSAADSVRLDARLNWCRFSPDGRMVSWDDVNGGYIASVDGKDASARRKYSPAGTNEARWSRDGKNLIYRAATRWFSVPVPAPGESPAPPHLIFEGQFNQALASWDVGPDGRFLLLLGVPPIRATHLNVITNFPRYVEEKLRGAR